MMQDEMKDDTSGFGNGFEIESMRLSSSTVPEEQESKAESKQNNWADSPYTFVVHDRLVNVASFKDIALGFANLASTVCPFFLL
jgi:hypothetical protein